MLATQKLHRLPAGEQGITLGDFLLPIRIGERMSARLRNIALIVLGTTLIALAANVAFRIAESPVPITGQTLAVLVVGGALGVRRGVLSVAFYLALGLFVPVYANHASGLGTIVGFNGFMPALSPVGGYLISFVIAAAVVGWLAENGWDRHVGGAIGAMVVGEVVIYVIAVPWLALSLGLTPADAIAKGFTPFLIGDAIKIAIAAGVFPAAWWLVGRREGDR
jgi:biotin transport system substrate-specific component